MFVFKTKLLQFQRMFFQVFPMEATSDLVDGVNYTEIYYKLWMNETHKTCNSILDFRNAPEAFAEELPAHVIIITYR